MTSLCDAATGRQLWAESFEIGPQGFAEVLCARGQMDEGLGSFRQAMHLNPLHPLWCHSAYSVVLHSAGRYAEATWQLNSLPIRSAFNETRLAICHAMLEHPAETARHLAEAQRLEPGWDAVAEVRRTSGFEHPADHVRFVAEAAAAAALRDAWAAARQGWECHRLSGPGPW